MNNQHWFSKHLRSGAKRARSVLTFARRQLLTPRMIGLGLVAIALVCAAIVVPPRRIWNVGGHQLHEDPSHPRAQLALGHALFSEGKRRAALEAYDHALAKDREVGDEKMYENLASCYGTEEQADASSLIARYKLVKIHDRLSALASDRHYKTRWGAIRTLEKAGMVSRSDFVHAWIADLDSPECEVRKQAVEELGKAGDRHALQALHRAKKKDEATKKGFLMFSSTCLGDRPDEAEKKILARR